MKKFQISENISLPCRPENVQRLCFEPFKVTNTSLLEGIDSGNCTVGGKQNVEGVRYFFCKLNELDGFDKKKIPKPENITIKVPSWMLETDGNCTFSSKKLNDLERHMLGVHSLMFRDHAYHCTHCEIVFVDRGQANTHMNNCPNIRRISECREKFPIHNEFLDQYLFWTSDKTVLSNRPKHKQVN